MPKAKELLSRLPGHPLAAPPPRNQEEFHFHIPGPILLYSYLPATAATNMDTGTDTNPRDNKNPTTNDNDDPFAPLLSLEQDYYTEGYSLGLTDGIGSGRIEGRLFGLEKGFDKFVQMGRLAARAAVWDARSPPGSGAAASVPAPAPAFAHDIDIHVEADGRDANAVGDGISVPMLSGSDRLRRHIDRLLELTDPESLETKNTEDAVNECDERLAGAKAKFTLISRIVGEGDVEGGGDGSGQRGGGDGVAVGGARMARTGGGREEGLEDESKEGAEVEITAPRNGKSRGSGKAGVARVGGGKGKGEMEDFGGLLLVKKG
ncbi:hypothetical protein LTR86_001252 [Recurvomyces mirabilis]|nr:hypothetical protein LTR86_001252 [Recurvomyces mirabilis]